MPKKALVIYKTATAERKLKEIIKYSAQKWGKKAAKEYAVQLEKLINSVARGEVKTKTNREFSIKFSYYRVKQHYIFFEIREDKLIVVAIFHVAMNIKKHLKN